MFLHEATFACKVLPRQGARTCGAQVYIASVAKSANGVEKASTNLSEIASKYSMTVLMANCVGPSDDFDGAGKTSIWNSTGILAGQLGPADEGILIINTETKNLSMQTV